MYGPKKMFIKLLKKKKKKDVPHAVQSQKAQSTSCLLLFLFSFFLPFLCLVFLFLYLPFQCMFPNKRPVKWVFTSLHRISQPMELQILPIQISNSLFTVAVSYIGNLQIENNFSWEMQTPHPWNCHIQLRFTRPIV